MSEAEEKDKKVSPWVIVNCPSCTKKIKLPREKLGSARFKCPLCSAKVSVASGEAPAVVAGGGDAAAPNAPLAQVADAPLAQVADAALESTDLVSQINPDLDDEEDNEGFLTRIRTRKEEGREKDEGEVIEKDGQTLVKRRRRVRKKKKVDTGPDWEADPDEADEGEKGNRDDEYSYVVETEVDAAGNVVERRRRVKGDQKRTTYERFAARMAKVFWGFTAMTALGLAAAVIYLIKAGSDSKGPGTAQIEERDTGEITSEITAEAFALVNRYLSAITWTERVQLVRNPLEVRPLMEAYYEKNGYTSRDDAFVIEQDGTKVSRRQRVPRREKADVLDVVFLAVGFPEGNFQYFALERRPVPGTDNQFEFLIDWEVSERFHAVSLEEFKDRAVPGATAEYRVSMQGQGSYFVLPFDDAKEWRCYRLSYPGDLDFELFGYTKVGTSLDQEVLDLFSVSGRPAPILKVALPEGKIYDTGAVEIVELVQSTWYR